MRVLCLCNRSSVFVAPVAVGAMFGVPRDRLIKDASPGRSSLRVTNTAGLGRLPRADVVI